MGCPMIWGNLFLVLHPETIKNTIMGVDISHIIRHGFRKVEDKKAAKAFVVNTTTEKESTNSGS